MIPSIMLASFMAVIGAAGPAPSLPEAAMYREMAAVRSLVTQKVVRQAAAHDSDAVPEAYDAALSYSQSRKQFGQSISEFQLIQKKLVDMAISLDAARFLKNRAAWSWNRGRRVTKESAMAKLFASEAAVQISNEAL